MTKEPVTEPTWRLPRGSLDRVEHDEIAYWRPETVGELLFSHRDCPEALDRKPNGLLVS